MSETNTKRIKLVVAYDGSDFCGWAPQESQRSVHGVLSRAVVEVGREEVELVGASRTDSGAHAKGQVCHFDTTRPIRPEKWVRAGDDLLPWDVRVMKAEFVHPDFHSRFWAVDRWYRYRIQTDTIDPHRTRYTFPYGRALDFNLMNQVGQVLVGEHDFLAFTQLLEPDVNTVRRIFSLRVRQAKDEIWIDVVATAYARGMMRRISGALYEIGRGHRDVAWLSELLDEKVNDKAHWPVVLPASGLTLMRVRHRRSAE